MLANVVVPTYIPTYNRADHLASAICSVLGQAYEQFQLIIVNDASPDNTPDNTDPLIHQFGDPRLQYVKRPKHGGGVAARNIGVLAARGELIAFPDQDDYWQAPQLE